MTITVTISTGSNPVPSPSAIMQALTMTMQEVEREVADEARLNIRVRSGQTRQSIHVLPIERLANGVRGGVGANDIGRYLEDGTATHSTNPDVSHEKYPIRPKNKKALAWPSAQGPSTMQSGSGRPLSYVEAGVRQSYGNKHSPPVTGAHVRLTGRVRMPIMRLLRSGAMPYQSVFTVRRGVMHPGIRPRPFMRPAMEAILPKAPETFLAMLAQVMRKK